MKFTPALVLEQLRQLPSAARYWLAFSGGLDSTLLLHVLAAQRTALPGELRAVHVNHHLNPRSDDWQRHCAESCAALQVPLECRSVEVSPEQGESLEAVARERRYAVFHQLLQAGDMLLLAQHRDDQLETFLLQALRGAGLRGLAAMPSVAQFGQGYMARPLLPFTRNQLHVWAEQEGLTWLEDPSNTDIRFDRNFLRQQIVPLLHQRWPSAVQTVARSARHCAEVLELLAAVAAEDRLRYADGSDRSLPLQALRELSRPRAKNLLRHWIEQLGLAMPPAHKLEQIFTDLLAARADRNPRVHWQGAEVRRYRQRLYAMPPLPEAPAEFLLKPGSARHLDPGMGVLQLVAASGEGIRLAACPTQGLRVSFRAGGEVCRPAGRPHHRPLKKWLQDSAVLPWMRQRLPLIHAGDELAAVAGMFVCAAFAAGEGEPGLRVEWRAHPPLR